MTWNAMLRPTHPALVGSAAFVLLLAGLVAGAVAAHADTSPQSLPFAQDWTNPDLITTDDNWDGVPGVIGYRGDGLVAATNVDPQTVVADGSTTPVDVNANRTDPGAFATGGVAEFQGGTEIAGNPVVAFQGSSTADAPHLVATVNTTGNTGIRVQYNLRDIDTGATTTQQVALQFRVGTAGNYTSVPAGYVNQAANGGTTPVNVVLPAAADNQGTVQIRVITTDAVGSDQFIGVDDIRVTGTPTPTATATPTPETSTPTPVIPEAPLTTALPLLGGALLAGAVVLLRARRRTA